LDKLIKISRIQLRSFEVPQLMRARRQARSDTPHPLDSRASLFHAPHNTSVGSVTTSAGVTM
jgi:hypothetical protein